LTIPSNLWDKESSRPGKVLAAARKGDAKSALSVEPEAPAGGDLESPGEENVKPKKK